MRCLPLFRRFKAILFVAAYAIVTWASAQNAANSADRGGISAVPVAPQAHDEADRAERARIRQERAQAGATHEAAKVQCYQQFVVAGCLSQARDQRNAQLADLNRQENALNDLQRKRRGALQTQRTDDRTTPQQQLEIAQQRGRALASAVKREERQAQKLAARAQQGASAAPATATMPQARQRSTPAGRQRVAGAKLPPTGKKPVQRQAKLPKAAKSTAAFEQRQKEAEEHRHKLQNRLQRTKKPPATPLPVPGS